MPNLANTVTPSSCCSCIIDPVIYSCSSLGSIAKKIANCVMGFFRTIAETLQSWLCCTRTQAPQSGTPAQTGTTTVTATPPAPRPVSTAPASPTLPAPAPTGTATATITTTTSTPAQTGTATATIATTTSTPAQTGTATATIATTTSTPAQTAAATATSAAALPVLGFGHARAIASPPPGTNIVEEGNAFLRARMAELVATDPNHLFFQDVQESPEKARKAFACLIVHDLVMHRGAVQGPFPYIINRSIAISVRTFISKINTLAGEFALLQEQARAAVIDRFGRHEEANPHSTDPSEVFLDKANDLASQFVQHNHDFIRCVDVLRPEYLGTVQPAATPALAAPAAPAAASTSDRPLSPVAAPSSTDATSSTSVTSAPAAPPAADSTLDRPLSPVTAPSSTAATSSTSVTSAPAAAQASPRKNASPPLQRVVNNALVPVDPIHEGTQFIRDLVQNFQNTHDEDDLPVFREIMSKQKDAIPLLAALVVYDLAMDRNLAATNFPQIVLCNIKNSQVSFSSQLNALRRDFLELTEKDKSNLKLCFLNYYYNLEVDVESTVVEQTFDYAVDVVQLFCLSNPTFRECALQVFIEFNAANPSDDDNDDDDDDGDASDLAVEASPGPAPAAPATPVIDIRDLVEGKLFLLMRAQHFTQTYYDSCATAFRTTVNDETRASAFLAALMIHDLLLGLASGPFPGLAKIVQIRDESLDPDRTPGRTSAVLLSWLADYLGLPISEGDEKLFDDERSDLDRIVWDLVEYDPRFQACARGVRQELIEVMNSIDTSDSRNSSVPATPSTPAATSSVEASPFITPQPVGTFSGVSTNPYMTPPAITRAYLATRAKLSPSVSATATPSRAQSALRGTTSPDSE